MKFILFLCCSLTALQFSGAEIAKPFIALPLDTISDDGTTTTGGTYNGILHKDSTGTSYPTLVTGKNGNGVSFNDGGLIEQYAEFVNNGTECFVTMDEANCPNGVTVAASIYVRTVQAGYLLGTSTSPASIPTAGFRMYIFGGATTNEIRCQFGNRDRAWTMEHGYEPTADTWYQVVCTWHKDNGVNMYINGALIGTAPLYSAISGGVSRGFFMGSDESRDSSDIIIDDVGMWKDVVLDPTDPDQWTDDFTGTATLTAPAGACPRQLTMDYIRQRVAEIEVERQATMP